MSNVHPINPGWGTVDPTEYDPEKKYTAASDTRGHSGWLKNLRVPSDIVGQIAIIVESGMYDEYTTQAAFVRDAIHHHLHKINEEVQSKNLKKVLSMNALNSQVQLRRAEAETYAEMMKDIKQEVADLIHHGAPQEARAFIAHMMGMEDAIADRFKAAYETEMKKLKEWADHSI